MCSHMHRSMLDRVTGYFTVDENSVQKSVAEETDSEVKLFSMLDMTIVNLLKIYQVYVL